jgi:hypothetical protein
MKNITFIVFICFAAMFLIAGVFALIQKRIDLACVSFFCGSISYAAYKDFKDPEQI